MGKEESVEECVAAMLQMGLLLPHPEWGWDAEAPFKQWKLCPKCRRFTNDIGGHGKETHQEEEDWKEADAKDVSMGLLLELSREFAENQPAEGEKSQLALADKIIVHLYTQESPVYVVVNRALREGRKELIQQAGPFLTRLQRALGKLLAFKDVAYRGINVWRMRCTSRARYCDGGRPAARRRVPRWHVTSLLAGFRRQECKAPEQERCSWCNLGGLVFSDK
jgi:hypothetical protein